MREISVYKRWKKNQREYEISEQARETIMVRRVERFQTAYKLKLFSLEI